MGFLASAWLSCGAKEAGGLTIGSGVSLGDTVAVGANQTVNVTNLTAVTASGLLALTDGRFNATGGVANNGEIRLGGGAAPRLSGGTHGG